MSSRQNITEGEMAGRVKILLNALETLNSSITCLKKVWLLLMREARVSEQTKQKCIFHVNGKISRVSVSMKVFTDL